MKANRINQVVPVVALMLVLGLPHAIAKKFVPIGGGGGGTFVGDALPPLYQALNKVKNGNLRGALIDVDESLDEARYMRDMKEADSLVILLRHAKQTVRADRLTNKEESVMLVDYLSSAVNILIRAAHTPGNEKKTLTAAIRHLRLARIVSEVGFTGKSLAEQTKAEFYLESFKGYPAIDKAIDFVSKAQKATDNNNIDRAQSMITSAIQTIQGSRVFNGVAGGGWD